MSSSHGKRWTFIWFPKRRFDPDFPLVYWFAGLWFYLKSFLYLCNVYMLGLEPPPYFTSVIAETAYFSATLIPCLIIGVAFWNEKRWAEIPAILFLVLDTPMLLFHVLRLAQAGYLDSGLTKTLEVGSLVLNVVALAWLIGNRFSEKKQGLSRG
jgi:hypothetical protein